MFDALVGLPGMLEVKSDQLGGLDKVAILNGQISYYRKYETITSVAIDKSM